MNRTALSVIAIAVGSVLIIGLFNIYKPAVSHLSHDVFSKVHIGHLGHKVHHYDGLNYTNDHGHIEILNGKISNATANKWQSDANYQGLFDSKDSPKVLKNATSIKVDNLDISGVQGLRYMFAWNSNLRTIDLGNLNTSHINSNQWGFDSMFQGDYRLNRLNLGPNFKINSPSNKWAFNNTFWYDGQLKRSGITGNFDPQMQEAFNHRMEPVYPK